MLKDYLVKHKGKLAIGLGLLLILVTLVRIVPIFDRPDYTDYLAYCDTTQAIMAGKNPYNAGNLKYKDWAEVPIVFPGYTFFFQPIAQNPQKFKSVYLLISILLAFLAMARLLSKTCLSNEPHPLRHSRGFLIYALLIFSFFNASPVLATLRQGQNSSIVCFCLLTLFTIKARWAQYLLFSTAAVMKYSMLTCWGPLLFAKRHIRLCLISFGFFILFAIYPIIYYPNIFELLTNYIKELSSQMAGQGFNTYSVSGYNMIHLDFLKISWLTTGFKFSVLGLAAICFFREYQTNKISLHLLFTTGCVTMLISYHRVYDVIILLPFLSLLCYEFFMQRKYLLLIIAVGFQLYFLIPESLLFRMSARIGQNLVGLSEFIHFTQFGDNTQMLPTHALVMTGLTCFAFYLNFFQPNLYVFKLDD